MFSNPNRKRALAATRSQRLVIFAAVSLFASMVATTQAQPPQCNPNKVVTAEACAKCHAGEVAVWKQTPHFQTFEKLHRNPRAKQISKLMGQRSVKRGNVCIGCHYTTQMDGDKKRVVSGVSCESCHGAAADWLALHNDYGGPTATSESETAAHRQSRIDQSVEAGMRNPSNIYLVAQSCLQCHTVPNEKLVNVGTHLPGTEKFELVAWSQGMVRHNFLRTNGESNATNSIERIRVMFIAGQIADLEFSTRATGKATERAKFGLTVANRAATVATRLYEIQQLVNNPTLEKILMKFSEARLQVDNEAQLVEIADAINQWGIEFASTADGGQLAAIDSMLPDKSQYIIQPSRR